MPFGQRNIQILVSIILNGVIDIKMATKDIYYSNGAIRRNVLSNAPTYLDCDKHLLMNGNDEWRRVQGITTDGGSGERYVSVRSNFKNGYTNDYTHIKIDYANGFGAISTQFRSIRGNCINGNNVGRISTKTTYISIGGPNSASICYAEFTDGCHNGCSFSNNGLCFYKMRNKIGYEYDSTYKQADVSTNETIIFNNKTYLSNNDNNFASWRNDVSFVRRWIFISGRVVFNDKKYSLCGNISISINKYIWNI